MIRPLCSGAVLLLMMSHVGATEWMALGPDRPQASILAKAGLGTNGAWLSGQVSADDALDFCADAHSDGVQACADALMAAEASQIYVVTADCKAASLTTADRRTLTLSADAQWLGRDGTAAGEESAVLDAHWDILCPVAVAEAEPQPITSRRDDLPAEVLFAALGIVPIEPDVPVTAANVDAVERPVEPEPVQVAAVDYGSAIAGIDHNGSLMWFDHSRGLLFYDRPKTSLEGIVQPGTVLFEGKPWTFDVGAKLEGTAYTFRKGCAPAPYQVVGQIEAGASPDLPDRIVLRGASPVRAKNGCAVLGYTQDSANATLVFDLHYGDV